jgi:hypothetical protein
MADDVDDPTYREMVRQARLVNRVEDARARRDELIRQLRAEGWELTDIAHGAGISSDAVGNICGE